MIFTEYIFVDGPEEKKLTEAVQSMANMYGDTGFTNGIHIYKSLIKPTQFIVNFENVPDFERFKYFVNYLKYPLVESSSSRVLGFWTISERDNLKTHLNERMLLYVSDHDTEGDNVYAISEKNDKTIKLGFAVGEEYSVLGEKEFDFVEPKFNSEEFSLIKTIDPLSKPKSSTGCMLFVLILIAISIYFII